MGCNFVGKVYIPVKDFMALLARHNPTLGHIRLLGGVGELAIGKIEFGCDDVTIEVAYSDYCHPSEWADMPAFMKEAEDE